MKLKPALQLIAGLTLAFVAANAAAISNRVNKDQNQPDLLNYQQGVVAAVAEDGGLLAVSGKFMTAELERQSHSNTLIADVTWLRGSNTVIADVVWLRSSKARLADVQWLRNSKAMLADFTWARQSSKFTADVI